MVSCYSRPDTCVIVKYLIHNYYNLEQHCIKSGISHLRRKEGRKEMFYLTTHSTHFIYGYMASDIMGKDHYDSEKGNPLPPHRLLFPISSKGSFYAPSHRQDSTYHGLCYTSRGSLAGTRNSSVER